MMGSGGVVFQGRAVLPDDIEGEARVTRTGFNTYATFYSSIHDPKDLARCEDAGNRDLFGRVLTDKIICLPKTIGSTSSGAVWHRIAQMGVAPRAMLFSQRLDSLAAGGLIVADIWGGGRICTVDQLGVDFLQYVNHDSWIKVSKDGSVTVYKS